jgi:membrane protease YdiL (CAAX protease family)
LLATVAIVGLSLFGAALLAPVLGLAGAADPRSAVLRLGVLGLGQVLMVALTLFASTLFGGRLREVLALREVPAGWRTYAGALLALAGLQFVLGIVQQSFRHDMATDLRPFADIVRGPYWPLVAAVVAVGAPLSEELLFRGFLLSALARSGLGFWGAAPVSNLPWAALHAGYSPVGIAEVFVIGLLFSWFLWRTGSLRVPIVCHALYNALVLLVVRFVDLPSPG